MAASRKRAPSRTRPGAASRRPDLAFALLAAAALAFGVFNAASRAWTTDDAYISFRYARNLVEGAGLVFNSGERVEGYSNFLWTLWVALGLKLGLTAERWANAWSIACYALTIALLVRFSRDRGRATGLAAVPVAALGAAFHRDWAIFATSGLETSCFTLLALAGFVLLAGGEPRPRRMAGAGALLALAALARPDGLVFTILGGGVALAIGRPRARALLACAAAALAVLAPYAAWKLWYYGDLVPNTYHAKSAAASWFSQGGIYLRLYFEKYWVLALGAVLAGAAALAGRRRGEPGPGVGWNRAAGIAATFALAYSLAVARVGGDFMFARLLVPATPFLLVLLELGLERFVPRPAWRVAAAAACIAAMAWTPVPVGGTEWKHGVADEWEHYRSREGGAERAQGERLRRLFQGLPVRVAVVGTGAILAYYSEVPVAIEATAGLTDSFIARQTLERRGRPGHEKHATFPYLIDQRKVHFILMPPVDLPDSVAAMIPFIPADLAGLEATVLHWDEPVMQALRARGAEIMDFVPTIDWYLREMPTLPDSAVRTDYARLRRYYFDTARDTAREAPFRRRLGLR